MDNILEIKNLNYYDFKNFNLQLKKNKYYTIIGPSNSGKTTLSRIICGIIPTNNICICNNQKLNKENVNKYIVNIGLVETVNKNSFLFSTVHEELTYSLTNLNYPKNKIKKRIEEVLNNLNILNIYYKNINELDLNEKQMLLFAIALLHKPSLLIIDDAFILLNKNYQKNILSYLYELQKNHGLSIIHFTNNFDLFNNIDYLYVLDNFKIKKQGLLNDLLEDDKLFYEKGIEVPFIVDLSNKLKLYGLVDKIHFNMEELVNTIWK